MLIFCRSSFCENETFPFCHKILTVGILIIFPITNNNIWRFIIERESINTRKDLLIKTQNLRTSVISYDITIYVYVINLYPLQGLKYLKILNLFVPKCYIQNDRLRLSSMYWYHLTKLLKKYTLVGKFISNITYYRLHNWSYPVKGGSLIVIAFKCQTFVNFCILNRLSTSW